MECRKVIAFLLTLLLATALFTVNVGAQDPTSKEAKTPKTAKAGYSLEEDMAKNPLKPPDTSSPRATLRSFLDNINGAYAVLMDAHRENMNAIGLFTSDSVEQMERRAEVLLQRAAYCLNLSGVPDGLKQDVGYEGAILLKEIFDRIELPPFEKIPDVKAIEAEEEKEKVAELNRWTLPNTAIIIGRVEEGPRMDEFLFTPETVARLGGFYGKVKDRPYKLDTVISQDFFEFYVTTPGVLLPPKWSRWLPAWSTAVYFGHTIWQWCVLVVLPLAALLVVWMLVRWWHRRSAELSPGKKFAGWILVILVAVGTIMLVKYVLDEHVNLTGTMLIFVESTLQRIFILLLAGLVIWEFMKGRSRRNIKEEVPEEESFGEEEMGAGGSRSETALLLLRKFFMAVMIVIVCLLLLSSMGINIGPLLAGAGVIGLAIGFGAQTLVKDIISGIFFLIDDAFRVGDYIETGGMRGKVEHISVRSLRLRHHRGMLITIPFGDMQSVTNFSRDYVVMKLAFRVRYDTDVEKVRKIVKKINKEIQKDKELGRSLLDKIKSQGVREMDDSAMIMRVKFTSVPGEQFVLRRVVYSKIQEAFQKNGIEFAHRNVTVFFPPEPSTTESESQGHEKEAESKTADQKKKEAAAAAALRTIEEEQTPKDKPDEP